MSEHNFFGGLLPICYILKNETWGADVLVAARSVRAFFLTNLRHKKSQTGMKYAKYK